VQHKKRIFDEKFQREQELMNRKYDELMSERARYQQAFIDGIMDQI